MTLINEITTRKEMVIAADRRLIDSTGVIEEVTKIVPLGEFAAAAIYGGPRALSRTREVQFDSYALLGEFYKANKYHDDSIRDAASFLVDRYNNHLKCNTELGGANNINKVVFQIVVFSHEGGEAKNFDVRFTMLRPYELSASITPNPHSDSRLRAYGNLDVIYRIVTGSDGRFDDLRAKPVVQRIFDRRRPPAFDSISEAEAIEFCPWLIAVSSERFPLVSDDLNPIGPTVDVARIHEGGFQWIKKH